MSEKKPAPLNDAWMIRPCEVYKEEYQDCKRWSSRLVQYYVDGENADCSVWLKDFNNCIAFREKKDQMAAAAVIAREKERRNERLQKAHANDIWEYRTSPPAEWSKPLTSKKTEEINIS